MAANIALEVRLELYIDGGFPEGLVAKISSLLSEHWPFEWDVRVPPQPSRQHPAEWRAVIPVPEGATAETLHAQMSGKILSLDTTTSFHLRSRWSFQETPNNQEVYEVRWSP